MPDILVISPDKLDCDAFRKHFNKTDNVIHAGDKKEAVVLASSLSPEVILLAGEMTDAIDTLKDIKQKNIYSEVIAYLKEDNPKACINLMKHGATNHFLFPKEMDQVSSMIDSLFEQSDSVQQVVDLANKALLEDSENRQKLLTIIKEQTSLTEKELFAFYPIHQREDAQLTSELQQVLGSDAFKQLQSCEAFTILIVDDEDFIRDDVKQLLAEYNFTILEAGSAQEALSQASQAEHIDLKILDIGLPDMSGVHLLPRLNDRQPQSQTIMLTSFADTEMVKESFKNKASDYINKPYDHQELLTKISKALQNKCFNELMPLVGQQIISEVLPQQKRLKMLTEIAQKREQKNEKLIMKEVYFFFPKLEASGVPKQETIPDEVLEDGLGVLVNILESNMQRGESSENILKEWDDAF